MPQILRKVDPRSEQVIIVTMRNRTQEEAQKILRQRRKIYQEKGDTYPVKYARKLRIQDFSDVQISRSTYQGDQMEQVAYPRTYASSASELYLISASTMA